MSEPKSVSQVANEVLRRQLEERRRAGFAALRRLIDLAEGKPPAGGGTGKAGGA